uniref:MlrC C-terminal domain-containing protein n=1 Tax=Mesorhizobium sp. WSM4875 TaxID=3038539 RepID=UPI0024E1BBB2|nr:MlrC C-terminal domain-containing protein [Mesorhizobium sp. WSM4875]
MAAPYILADMGDRVLAGVPGDSTAIIEHALARGGRLRGAIPVTDPLSVEAAAEAAGCACHARDWRAHDVRDICL